VRGPNQDVRVLCDCGLGTTCSFGNGLSHAIAEPGHLWPQTRGIAWGRCGICMAVCPRRP